jgi:hypothetical protein
MDSVEVLTRFFGWCAVINIGLLLLTIFFVAFMRGFAIRVHRKMFALSEDDISRAYFRYLAQYKILTLVFSVVPYFALKLVT